MVAISREAPLHCFIRVPDSSFDSTPTTSAGADAPRAVPSALPRNASEQATRPNAQLLPPLSPLTYYRRNVARSLPIGGAIMISVFLIAGIVTLLNSVDDSIIGNYGFVRHFSVLVAQLERDVSPPLKERVRSEKRLKRIIHAVPYLRSIKTVFGELPVPFYGLDPQDMPEIMALTNNKLVQGRLPRPGEPEVVLSRMWANNIGVKLNSKFTNSDERFPTITSQQTVVGILDGGSNLAMADIDFVIGSFPDINVIRPAYLLIPNKPSDLPAINKHIDDFMKKPEKYDLSRSQVRYAKFFTHEDMVNEIRKSLGYFFNFLAIADGLVIGAVALLSGFLANIYFESRLGEFGLLLAMGFQRSRLAGRLFIETGALVVVSWLMGLAFTWCVLRLLDTYYMTPRGLILAHINSLALFYTLPTPFLVGIASLGTVLLRLYRLDAISIMERR